jgi:hypothetical protein
MYKPTQVPAATGHPPTTQPTAISYFLSSPESLITKNQSVSTAVPTCGKLSSVLIPLVNKPAFIICYGTHTSIILLILMILKLLEDGINLISNNLLQM